MTKWEYKTTTFNSWMEESFVAWLNLYGAIGWELVNETVSVQRSSDYSIYCVFKREIKE